MLKNITKNSLIILAPLLILLSTAAGAKDNLHQITAADSFDNIHLVPLGTDKHASEYLIFIKNKVAPHYHARHTEIIYILEGTAKMSLAGNISMVKAGDYIRVPEGAIHSVEVTSKRPLKVLSVQTPEFKGKDRIFITEK